MTWSADAPQGNESFKIRWEIVRYTRGKGLDLGCGRAKLYPHFIGIDNNKDAGLFNIEAHPDIHGNAEDLSMFATQSMDFVFSSHLLEHYEYKDVPNVLKEWWRVLKKDGYLTLYLPDEDEYPKIGEPHANIDHKWNVNKDRVLHAMEFANFDLVECQKRNKDDEYSLLFVFKKIANGKRYSYQNPRPEKTCGVIRYGAFGDLIQASSVFAGLKKQGYHITLYTSAPGDEVIRHDPNIDEFYLQDKDQVPNAYLGDYWAYHSKKYDKWVNLSETIEGTFLTIPGRTVDLWNPVIRHKLCNFNYLEMQHVVAGVPHNPQMKFYALPSELEWARKERSKMGRYVILWSLAGSSVHKTWAGLDRTIAALMVDFNDVDVVLVGGPNTMILEAGWQKEPRVHCRAGVWSIRQTMAFLNEVDCVVGPETGVLNAAAQMNMPKFCFLSHSTEENLTRDWVNTYSISSPNTTCPGRGNNAVPACHQLHYDWSRCKQVKEGEHSGTSQCMADIDGRAFYMKLQEVIYKALEEAA